MGGFAQPLRSQPRREDEAPDQGNPQATLPGLTGDIARAQAVLGTMGGQARAYRYQRLNDTEIAERIAEEDAYDAYNDEIFRITGRRLNNPTRDEFMDPLGQGSLTERFGGEPGQRVQAWHDEVAALARSDPRVGTVTRQQVFDRAVSIASEARRNYHEYLDDGGFEDRLARGLTVVPGMLAGGVSTLAPSQIAQFGATGGSRGLSIFERAVADALANMTAQAAVEPAIIESARRHGEDYPAEQIVLDFTLAGVLGAALGAAGGGQGEAPIRRTPEPPLREAVTLPSAALDVTPSRVSPDASAAVEGRAEALIVAARERDLATARELRFGEDDFPVEALTETTIANDRYVRGETERPAALDHVRQAEPDEIAAAVRQADEGPRPEPGTREQVSMNGRQRPRTFERFDASALAFDPVAFQFKRSEGQQGSTGRLDGVEAWDGQSAGKIVVFEAADGRLYVGDGHQRVALAQALAERDGQAIALDGYRYREADGWTRQEVRHLAAQKNLRETVGDPIDAAMLMREAPELIDTSIPQRGADFRLARSLSRLSDEAFAAVRAGKIEPRFGAVIGEVAATRPEMHAALADMFIKNPPASAREAAFIAREATMSAAVRMEAAQISMFGDQMIIAGMQERAAILARAGDLLREDKRVFAVAERHADDLEAAGNILATEENARRKDIAAALSRELDTLATRPGPVADVLRDIAARAAENKTSAKVAAREFADRITALLEERGLVGLYTDAPPRPAPPPKIEPLNMEAEARSATLRGAHDRDAEALNQSMAEVALERAMRGETGEVIAEDAIGHTPEADIARIEKAAEALGIDADSPKVHVAAAILARADEGLATEARARLAPTREEGVAIDGEPAPETFADAAETGARIEAPFRPEQFDDSAKLAEAIDGATLPELEAVAALRGDKYRARTRAEYRALLMRPPEDDGVLANIPDARSETPLVNSANRFRADDTPIPVNEGWDTAGSLEAMTPPGGWDSYGGNLLSKGMLRRLGPEGAYNEIEQIFAQRTFRRERERIGDFGAWEQTRENIHAAYRDFQAQQRRAGLTVAPKTAPPLQQAPDGPAAVDGTYIPASRAHDESPGRQALTEADNIQRIVDDLKDCK